MVVYNYSGKEINAKIVYYGPALSGKTTNLEWIYSKIPLEYSGKMISLRTQTDRTIFFDFLPLELGLIDGFKTRFMLYTVPGQVYYNATRKMVLKGVDGVVFVADSEQGRMQDNVDSLQNLRENLVEIGLDLDTLPLVLQWNKRDLPNCMSPSEMEEQLNALSVPSFPASALTGEGVYETLHCISKMIYKRLTTGEQAAAQSMAPGREEETSLFGQDIASRLKQVDLPVQEIAHEPLAVEPRAVRDGARSDGAVLDAILGAVRTGNEPAMVPAGGPPSGATARATAAGHRPGMSQSVRPAAPSSPPSVSTTTGQTRGGPARSAPPPAGGPPRSHEQELVSDLVDNVLSPMEAPGGRGRAGGGPELEIPGDDPLTYGSSYGRMVTLDGKDAAARKAAGVSAPAPAPAPPPAAPPPPAAASPIAAAPAPTAPAPPSPELSLELITDPRKLKSSATRPDGAPALDSAQVSFADRMGGSKIIEVPITLDADAFADGKSLRIVLNLKLAR